MNGVQGRTCSPGYGDRGRIGGLAHHDIGDRQRHLSQRTTMFNVAATGCRRPRPDDFRPAASTVAHGQPRRPDQDRPARGSWPWRRPTPTAAPLPSVAASSKSMGAWPTPPRWTSTAPARSTAPAPSTAPPPSRSTAVGPCTPATTLPASSRPVPVSLASGSSFKVDIGGNSPGNAAVELRPA